MVSRTCSCSEKEVKIWGSFADCNLLSFQTTPTNESFRKITIDTEDLLTCSFVYLGVYADLQLRQPKPK